MARGYANVKFQWNGKASTVIKNLGFGKPLQLEAARIFEWYMQPYIPYDEGDLSTRIRITATETRGTITHLVKYANKQYYGDGSDPETGSPGYDEMWQRNRSVHPLATSFWDKAAWTQNKREITRDIDKARQQYRSFKY